MLDSFADASALLTSLRDLLAGGRYLDAAQRLAEVPVDQPHRQAATRPAQATDRVCLALEAGAPQDRLDDAVGHEPPAQIAADTCRTGAEPEQTREVAPGNDHRHLHA